MGVRIGDEEQRMDSASAHRPVHSANLRANVL